jgi:hypothetical protein
MESGSLGRSDREQYGTMRAARRGRSGAAHRQRRMEVNSAQPSTLNKAGLRLRLSRDPGPHVLAGLYASEGCASER